MFEEAITILGLIIFGAVGLLLLVIALGVFIWTRRFIRQSLSATGEVISLVEDHTEGSVTYAPRIRFTTVDGSPVEFTDQLFSRPSPYKPGDRVTVLYHQKNFNRARLGTNGRLYYLAGLLASIGSVFFGVALVTLFLVLK